MDSMHTNKNHFDQSIAQYRSTEVADRNLEGFIKSFKYPEMYHCQNADSINRAHEGTFRWIFEEEDNSDHEAKDQSHSSKTQRWSSFSDWLTSEDSLYWISGKPGSGKSCLMRFLATNLRTGESLKKWKPHVQILSAYIWLAGSLIQRSQKGVLTTLLHQLLLNNEQTAKILYFEYAQSSKDTISDWSFAELQNCLFKALRSIEQGICIFVDGLDEIDPKEFGGKLALTKLLKDIASLPNIKVCVGSREEVVFKDAYKDYPQLRLQDLTIKDIKKHTRDSLQVMLDNDKIDTTSDLAREQFDDLVQQISQKAEGVFLWVSVVVSNTRRAYLEDCEDMEGLLKRIEQLPTDISQLYTEMWSRLNPDDKHIYKTESALYFQIALLGAAVLLWEMAACIRTEFMHDFLAGGPKMTQDRLERECEKTKKQLHARCAGLLQVSPPFESEDPLFPSIANSRISFIHRSAHDWFRDTIHGREILRHSPRKSDELHLRAFLVRNVRELYRCWPRYPQQCEKGIETFMDHVRRSAPQLEEVIMGFIAESWSRCLHYNASRDPYFFLRKATLCGCCTFTKSNLARLCMENNDEETRIKFLLLGSACRRLWSVMQRLSYRCYDRVSVGYESGELMSMLEMVLWLLSNDTDGNPPKVIPESTENVRRGAVLSCLFAINLCLEQIRYMPEALQFHILSFLCKLLEFRSAYQNPVLVAIGPLPIYRHFIHYHCWSCIGNSRDAGLLSAKRVVWVNMQVCQIFRYTHTLVMDWACKHTLSKEQRKLLEVFFDETAMNTPFSAQKRYIDDENQEVRIIELNDDIIHAGIKLAEYGVSALFKDSLEEIEYVDEPIREELGPRVQELWEILNSCKVLGDDALSIEKYVGQEEIEEDDPNFVPTFEAIDWSEKPEYERLDRAINEFFASAEAQDLE